MKEDYLQALNDWLNHERWWWLVTLTNKHRKDGYWYQKRLELLSKAVAREFPSCEPIEYAASVELTKNEIKHCHALIRNTPSEVYPFRHVVPSKWYERQQHSNMIRFLHYTATGENNRTLSIDDIKSGSERVKMRSGCHGFAVFVKVWYQANYGAMADAQLVRDNDKVINYALKYALKALDKHDYDWFISSNAVKPILH